MFSRPRTLVPIGVIGAVILVGGALWLTGVLKAVWRIATDWWHQLTAFLDQPWDADGGQIFSALGPAIGAVVIILFLILVLLDL